MFSRGLTQDLVREAAEKRSCAPRAAFGLVGQRRWSASRAAAPRFARNSRDATTEMQAAAAPTASFRDNYDNFGVDGYYGTFGAKYRNPNEGDIRRALKATTPKWKAAGLQFTKMLDLACGSGEVTLALQELFGADKLEVTATDPYTHAAFKERTGMTCETVSFEDIENGAYEERRWDCIFSCFALHLVEDSHLLTLCTQLGLIARHLVVISPHKRPEITPVMGWTLRQEVVVDRIRVRWYESALFAA